MLILNGLNMFLLLKIFLCKLSVYTLGSRIPAHLIFLNWGRFLKSLETTVLEPHRNVLVNISHTSCACNGDHVGVLIKTGSIQKEKMMAQTTIRNF